MRIGHAVLSEIDRKEAHVKPRKSFDSRMEDNPCTRYRYVFRTSVCFIRRTGREVRTERGNQVGPWVWNPAVVKRWFAPASDIEDLLRGLGHINPWEKPLEEKLAGTIMTLFVRLVNVTPRCDGEILTVRV